VVFGDAIQEKAIGKLLRQDLREKAKKSMVDMRPQL